MNFRPGISLNFSFILLLTALACGCDESSPPQPDACGDECEELPIFDPPETCDFEDDERTVGVRRCLLGTEGGYTLFAPMTGRTAFLIDSLGRLVHSWNLRSGPGLAVYLLDSGHLLAAVQPNRSNMLPLFAGGGAGRVVELDWNSNVLWDFEYHGETYRLHHDIVRLPNGNTVMIAWEVKTPVEAIAAGRDPRLLEDRELWIDHLIEVDPDGEIVWEWHLWDHLIQDRYPAAGNYGAVVDHPELVDFNHAQHSGADWNHTNAVDYNAELDQLIISVRYFSEFWIIDHSCTTEEAAGHSGCAHGRGGDLLYRWGNPQAYRAGQDNDQALFQQHNAHWIPPGLPGEGDVLVFNNGLERPGGEFSSVLQVTPPLDADGGYRLEPGSAFAPIEPTWSFEATPPSGFYSSNLSGAQRLAGGNTLICSGRDGRFLEVTSSGEVVWEYVNPVIAGGHLTQGETVPEGDVGPINRLFRATRIPEDHPALVGRTLTPEGTLENY